MDTERGGIERRNREGKKVVDSQEKASKQHINSTKGNWECRMIGRLFSKKKLILGLQPTKKKEQNTVYEQGENSELQSV